MRRRQAKRHAPHATCLCRVDAAQGIGEDAAPRQASAEDRAAQRIEEQQFDARTHIVRNRFITQARDERGHATGIRVCAYVVVLVHWLEVCRGVVTWCVQYRQPLHVCELHATSLLLRRMQESTGA